MHLYCSCEPILRSSIITNRLIPITIPATSCFSPIHDSNNVDPLFTVPFLCDFSANYVDALDFHDDTSHVAGKLLIYG